VTHPFSERVTVGLGLFVPFGLATDWPSDWEGRFQVTFASIRATVVRPTVAWHPVGWLSIAGGPDIAQVSIEQRRQINMSRVSEDLGMGPLPGNPEGRVSLEGDAQAFGYHLSALVEPSDVWQMGVTFRSRLHAEVNDGHAHFEIPVPAFQPAFPDGTARTEVDLPPAVGVGVLMRPRPEWNVEADANWTGWSTVDRLVVRFDQGLPVSSETTDFLWRNSWSYSVGTEYNWTPYVLRAGYTFDRTPIPDATVTPVIADGNRQYFSLGAGVKRSTWDLNFGYQLLLFRRTKDNAMGAAYSSSGSPPGTPAINAEADGLYKTYSHTIVFSLTRRF
jgi:long-chain fatty acid transport protein